jgi:hypothetical protein
MASKASSVALSKPTYSSAEATDLCNSCRTLLSNNDTLLISSVISCSGGGVCGNSRPVRLLLLDGSSSSLGVGLDRFVDIGTMVASSFRGYSQVEKSLSSRSLYCDRFNGRNDHGIGRKPRLQSFGE